MEIKDLMSIVPSSQLIKLSTGINSVTSDLYQGEFGEMPLKYSEFEIRYIKPKQDILLIKC